MLLAGRPVPLFILPIAIGDVAPSFPAFFPSSPVLRFGGKEGMEGVEDVTL